jgi:hypothetical protein
MRPPRRPPVRFEANYNIYSAEALLFGEAVRVVSMNATRASQKRRRSIIVVAAISPSILF